MAFPPPTQTTSVTDATEQTGLHPQLHNANGQAINDLTGEAQRINGVVVGIGNNVTALGTRVTATEAKLNDHEAVLEEVYGATARSGMIRGRSNIDAVTNGGSVRYTVGIYDDFTIVDTGDGSGFTVGAGVYAVTASTIADAGSDLTCYLNIGARSVAVGSRIPNDATTYLTWVGRVLAGEQINVRVSMPVPRAVVGGRLEIWRVAVSD